MKTRHFFLTLVALLAFAGNAWAQKDITSQYITNATLSDGTTGWTVSNFNTPQQGNNTVGYASEAYAGFWSFDINSYSLTQNITLPAGSYRLVNYSFFRQGEAYDTDNTKSLAYLKAGSNQVAIKTLGSITAAGYANSQEEGANCFDSKMYRNVLEFTLDAQTTLEIGITGTFDEARSWCIAGMFELFDMNDLASVSSPTDMTYAITNSGFEYRDLTGWTTTGDPGGYANGTAFSNKAGIGMVEKWSWAASGNYTGSLKQTLSGLENGLYEVTVYAQNIHQQNNNTAGTGMYLVANDDHVEIGTSKQYTVRTTVTDGTLNLGIDMNNATGNWVVWDRFGLLFYGDPLAAYKDLLDAKIVAAQALYSTLKSGPQAYLQGVVAANNNENDTFTTEAEFNTAVSNIEAAMSQVTTLDYSAYDSYRTQITALSSGAEASTELTTFNNAVDAADAAIAVPYTQASLDNAITTQIANLRSAGLTYISSVDGQYNITFLASQTYSDWKNYYGNAAGPLGDTFLTNRPPSIPQFPEFWIGQADLTGKQIYQTVKNLPAGYYQVSMYAGALSTSERDSFATEASDGDSDRTFAYAGDESDSLSIMRTGMPIKFATVVDFSDLTILDVNVHLTGSGQTNDLTFGITKDKNGSNWHFAQIASIVYSRTPDLTNLQNTRDQLVAEAEGLLASSARYLTSAQQTALSNAITSGNNASTFDELNTATLTTLPDAINTANQQISIAKTGIAALRTALERFELDYNLADGTDYRRVTMSAKAWTDLLTAVNTVTTDLDDISLSRASSYATDAAALVTQMDATDVSIRLFKSYKAMVDGCQSLSITEGTTYAVDSNMDNDTTEQTAITALNTAFKTWAATQVGYVDVAGFLGDNLDFNTARTTSIKTDDNCSVYDIVGWEEDYANLVAWSVLDNSNSTNPNMLYIRSNWTATAVKLNVMKEKMLPEGKYKLSLSWNSTLGNMVNNSAYVVDGTSTTIGQNVSSATTLEYEFEITDNAKPFDIIIGLTKNTANADNHAAQIIVDDITLQLIASDEFKYCYEAAQTANLNTAATAAAKSAVSEYADNYASTADLNGFADATARQAAINVLKNAKIIANANGDATSFITNADLSNTTVTNRTPYGWTKEKEQPDGDGGDVWIRKQEIAGQDSAYVFNYWRPTITDIEFYQTLTNLPQGAYRFSADMGSDPIPAGLVLYVNPQGNPIGASQQVNTQNYTSSRAFGTYSAAAEVGTAHQVTIGMRGNYYFQAYNFRLEYIGDASTAAAETDASYIRQDYYWSRDANGREFDFTSDKYKNATGVTLHPGKFDGGGKNQVIRALPGQLTNTENVVVKNVVENDTTYTCAKFVITDGYPLVNTTAFTTDSVTYSRNMANTWGTLILPCPLKSDDTVQYYTLSTVTGTNNSNDDGDTMGFTPVAEVAANTPVVFKKLAEATSVTMIGSGTVALTAAEQGSSIDTQKVSGWTMAGVYAVKELTTEELGTAYYIANNQFWKATEEVGLKVNPFRAYFTGPAATDAKSFRIKVYEGESTRIVDLQHGIELGGDIYTVGGQLVRRNAQSLEGLQRGVYIIGGKKVVIK